MEATDILSSEHRVIEHVIAALHAAAGRLEEGQAVRPAFFLEATRFIRDFADGHHHGKEEGVLFEAMARHGMQIDAGPIGMMRYEHARARELTAGLGEAAGRLAKGDRNAAEVVADYARAYGELLTQHIAKEDRILFPMAARVIPPGEQDKVVEEFGRVERAQEGKGTKEAFLELARGLGGEMGVEG